MTRRRSLLLPGAVAAVAFAVLIGLGVWQLYRKVWKENLIATLAERMIDPTANPLVPRVLVNRIWKHHFGEGLVKSTDDFGAMGRAPSKEFAGYWQRHVRAA